MLFQDLRIFTELTAIENVQLKNNLTGQQEEKRDSFIIEKLGISDKLNVKAGKTFFRPTTTGRFYPLHSASRSTSCFCISLSAIWMMRTAASWGEIIIDEAGKQGAGVIATSIGKHIELPYKEGASTIIESASFAPKNIKITK